VKTYGRWRRNRTKYEHKRRKNKKQMTEDRRIPVDINTAVDAVIRELDRLEGLGKDELARSGIDLYS